MKKICEFIPIFIFLFIVFAPCQAKNKKNCGDSLPIIYSPHYNISILGIENFHPFDSKKYRKVYKHLISKGELCASRFYKPELATEDQLLMVHSGDYLESLKKSKTVAAITEIPILRVLPGFYLRSSVLKPMLYATGGTILGVELALKYGWAINLSGGYHHAHADHGGGFCIYADVPIALQAAWKERPSLKVLIVDLDAHQGDGNSTILGKDPRVAILDIYNEDVFPHDSDAEALVKYNVPLRSRTHTEQYLKALKEWLPFAVDDHEPDLIIYNAGTDIFLLDQLGRLSVSPEGIIERDDYVFSTALQRKIPILMVLSGGYNKRSGHIIGRSILNLIESNKLNGKEYRDK
ncbi:MAG: histone deacetylase [Chitinispirillaceae bacterium]